MPGWSEVKHGESQAKYIFILTNYLRFTQIQNKTTVPSRVTFDCWKRACRNTTLKIKTENNWWIHVLIKYTTTRVPEDRTAGPCTLLLCISLSHWDIEVWLEAVSNRWPWTYEYLKKRTIHKFVPLYLMKVHYQLNHLAILCNKYVHCSVHNIPLHDHTLN